MRTYSHHIPALLAFAAAAVFCQGMGAQESAQSLTLNQARELALEHNKDIAKSRLTLEQTTNDAKAYRTNYFPRINLIAADLYSTTKGDFSIAGGHLPIYMLNPATGTYLPNATVGADGSITLGQYADFPSQKLEYKVGNVFMGGVTLTQPLYMGGKITAAYRMASRGADMARENIRLTESQVLLEDARPVVNVERPDPAKLSAAANALGSDIRALCDHLTHLVLGRTSAGTLTLRVDEHGLWGSIRINEHDSDAMNLYARVQRGDVSQCSFGFDILDEEYIENPDGSCLWIIREVLLYEVSVVTFPAYSETSVQARQRDRETIRRRSMERRKNALKERIKTWH